MATTINRRKWLGLDDISTNDGSIVSSIHEKEVKDNATQENVPTISRRKFLTLDYFAFDDRKDYPNKVSEYDRCAVEEGVTRRNLLSTYFEKLCTAFLQLYSKK